MKNKKITLAAILLLSFTLLLAAPSVHAETVRAGSQAGVVLRKKDTGTTDTSDSSDGSTDTDDSSSGSGTTITKPDQGGGKTAGGKTYFPQTGEEAAKMGLSILGAALAGFALFFLWKRRKKDEEQEAPKK